MDTFELDIKPVEQPATNKRLKFIDSAAFEYELYKLVDEYDLVLREQCEFFDFEKPPIASRYLAVSLFETMKHHHGLGLAANQCGIKYRVLAVNMPGKNAVMFNPIVIETKGEPELGTEGCLSFPGLELRIKRAPEMTVSFFDMDGQEQELRVTGLTARVIQHEMDHLDGVVFTSFVSPMILDNAKRKVKKNLKMLKKRQEEHQKQELIAQAMKNLYKEDVKQKSV